MDGEQPDVATLLARTRKRDPVAAEALVAYLYPVVVPVIQRRLPQGAELRDLVQEVFLKLFANLGEFRGSAASLDAWARRIAFRTCLNQIRHRERRPELRWADLSPEQVALLDSTADAGEGPDPSRQVAARDLLDVLLSRLSPKERALFELIELEDRDLDEVQRLTGWSRVNLRVRLHRARTKLRRAWRQLLADRERP